MWLIYVLIKRLEARLPTAIQFFPDAIVWFDDAGPHSISNPTSSDGISLPNNAWLLSDSGDRLFTPSVAFSMAPSSAKIILASSPASHRWKGWAKQASADLYVMDVWGDIELAAMLCVLLFSFLMIITPCRCLSTLFELDIPKGLTLAAKWGPCARLVNRCLMNPSYEENLTTTVTTAVINAAQSFSAAALGACEELDFSDNRLSSSIFFVRPRNRLIDRAFGRVVIPTPFLAKVLLAAVTKEDRERQLKFLSVMSNDSSSSMGVAAGLMFESIFYKERSKRC
jgi:hypothetical protein